MFHVQPNILGRLLEFYYVTYLTEVNFEISFSYQTLIRFYSTLLLENVYLDVYIRNSVAKKSILILQVDILLIDVQINCKK